MVKDKLCPVCHLEVETTGHILCNCPSAKDVWMLASRTIQNSSICDDDFGLIFRELVLRSDNTQLELVAVIARGLWLRINKLIF